MSNHKSKISGIPILILVYFSFLNNNIYFSHAVGDINGILDYPRGGFVFTHFVRGILLISKLYIEFLLIPQ